jgi:hypothetical protein
MEFPGEKLVIKLWETVAEKGVGGLFKPWQMRREGRASIELKREELLTIAQAEHDADRIRRGEVSLAPLNSSPLLLTQDGTSLDGTETPSWRTQLLQAASNIIVAETVQREANVTRALLHAEEVLETDTQTPPDANVNEDWLYRWRDSVSQVSAEELQNLWGRLLAGEVKAPGTYSLRTLEFLRNLSQSEAEAIAKLSQFVVDEVIYREAKDILEKAGVTFGFLLYMQQMGVVSGVEAIGLSITWKSVDASRFVRALRSNTMVLVATADDPNHTLSLPSYQLTAIGKQVLRLGKFEPNVDYLKKVAEHLKGQGVQVELAQYVDVSPSQIRYFNSQTL